MAAQRQDDERGQEQGTTGKALKRRGLMAAAAALVAGIVATKTSQPVRAVIDDVAGTHFIAQSANGTAYITSQPGPPYFYDFGVNVQGNITGVQGTTVSGHGVYGVAGTDGTGVYGLGANGSGVVGIATTGYGVQGTSSGLLPGVYGSNGNGNNAIGVQGDTGGSSTGYGVLGGRMNVSGSPFNGIGVQGRTDGGHGVHGDAASGNGVVGTSGGGNGTAGVYGTGITYGVYGTTSSGGNGVTGVSTGNGGAGVVATSADGYGVFSTSGATNAAAVYGRNSSSGAGSYGVYGIASVGTGVWGEAGTGQGSGGVIGVSRHANAVGFQALAVSPATYAGFFVGTVSITGSLGVSGGKFAVVKGQDGQYRGMYAVESPECWFEDFGTGTLVNGKAEVKLDPLFAQHVHADSYHVFLSPHDADHHLTAITRAGQSFNVQASPSTDAAAKGKKAADLSGTFSYRIVAKRNDIKGERMPVWEMPAGITIPDPPKVDPSPLPPAAPVPPPSAASPQPAPAPVPPLAVSSPVASPGAPAPNPLPPSRP